jgi:hypothetical protein
LEGPSNNPFFQQKNGRGVGFHFVISFRFNLNSFADKQGKMGLVSAHPIMYGHAVVINEI